MAHPGPTPTPSAPDWDALRPGGAYARVGQPVLNALLLLVALPPALVLGTLVAAVNAVIFRDPRRVFFVQERAGLRGVPFRMYKFRTMREVAPGSDTFGSWSGGDLLRVTAFGRLLRNTHLDELPQLWNVLKGDMRFIGPRPEMLSVEEWARHHVPGFERRLAIHPGLTGEAQITQGYTGHDVEAYTEKLAINEAYRARMSLRCDLSILARTVLWVLGRKGWWRTSASPQQPEPAPPAAVEPPASAPQAPVPVAAQSRLAGTTAKSSNSGL